MGGLPTAGTGDAGGAATAGGAPDGDAAAATIGGFPPAKNLPIAGGLPTVEAALSIKERAGEPGAATAGGAADGGLGGGALPLTGGLRLTGGLATAGAALLVSGGATGA